MLQNVFARLDARIPQDPATRTRWGVLVLVVMCAIWGTTFPAQKVLSGQLQALEIMLLRFGLAALLLLPFLRGLRAVEWRWGLLLSAAYFLGFWLQTEGLARTSSNRNAFITGLSVLAVPLLSVFIGHAPRMLLWLACAMAAAGMWLLFYQQAPWNMGDSLTLAAMLCFALYIILLERSAERNQQQPLSALGITAIQCSSVMLGSALLLALQGQLLAPQGTLARAAALTTNHWWVLGFLAVIASALSPAMQVWGQRYVSAVQSAIIYGLEPVFAAITAWLWIGEQLTGWALLGAVLIVLALLVSQIPTKAAGSTR